MTAVVILGLGVVTAAAQAGIRPVLEIGKDQYSAVKRIIADLEVTDAEVADLDDQILKYRAEVAALRADYSLSKDAKSVTPQLWQIIDGAEAIKVKLSDADVSTEAARDRLESIAASVQSSLISSASLQSLLNDAFSLLVAVEKRIDSTQQDLADLFGDIDKFQAELSGNRTTDTGSVTG